MRILFLLPSLPFPPSDGGKTKVFNLLKYLSPRHECDIICFGTESAELRRDMQEALPHIGRVRIVPYPSRLSRLAGMIGQVFRLNPPSFARFANRQIEELLSEARASGQYDVVHYDIINMARYHCAGAGIASVHSPNDATSQLYFRLAEAAPLLLKLKLYFSASLLRRFERNAYSGFCKVHVVSDDDKRYLEREAPGAEVEVIPISSGYSYELCHRLPALRPAGVAPLVAVCGNLGDLAIALGFEAFLNTVFPQVCQAFPNLRLRVLGRHVADRLVQRLKAFPNIEYLTWVEDFEAFITEADVILVPDMAGAPGAKTRVVQAMALGMAVLGSETAFEGVPVESGRHGLIYTSPDHCLAHLVALLGSAPLRQALGTAAARLAAEEYSLDRIGPKYEALYYAAKARYSERAGAAQPLVGVGVSKQGIKW